MKSHFVIPAAFRPATRRIRAAWFASLLGLGALARTGDGTSGPAAPATVIVHAGFEGFRAGTLGDSGANTYISSQGVQTIHRGDLNRDGEIDLVFTQDHNHDYSPDAMIYWGGPDGPESLQPELPQYRTAYSRLKHAEHALKKVTWLPSMGGGRGVIADLDLDGYPDIVSGNMMHNFRQDMPASIYWGSARGFQEKERTMLPAYIASGIAVADLNEDGLPDIVIANQGFERGFDLRFGEMTHAAESYIYWGHPTGFDVSRRTTLATLSAADAAVGDFNGDGHADVAFANNLHQEQTVYVYWGKGEGGFTAGARQVLNLAETSSRIGGRPLELNTLLAADLDADGASELVVGATTNAWVFRGAQGGLNAAPVVRFPAENCHALDAADVNRDGTLDLIVANAGIEPSAEPSVAGGSVIYWGSVNGFAVERATRLPTLAAKAVKTADFNRDGWLDVVFGNSSAAADLPAQIFWGSAAGLSAHRQRELQAFGPVGVGAADLDRDGHQDLLLLSHLSGDGEGTLPTQIYWGNPGHDYSKNSMTQLKPGGYMMYTTADFDDDGFVDLVLVEAGKPSVWWGGASGYSAANRTLLPLANTPGGGRVSGMAVADVDRDGSLDLICAGKANRDATVGSPSAIIIHGGTQRFAAARVESIPLAGGPRTGGAIAVSIADLNQDGRLDLIFPLLDIGRARILWGSAEGYAATRCTDLETNGASHAAVADLDRDGWLEIIVTSGLYGKREPGQPAVGGSGVKGATRNGPSYIYWGSRASDYRERTPLESFSALDATVADLNRDGHLDIALCSYLSDTTRELPALIYWGDGTRTGYSVRHRTLLDGASSSAIDARDLNRDGWPELVITNHQKDFSHLSGTDIYWGGEKGYSISRRTNLPTIGSHLDTMVDGGNIATRRNEWDYLSAPIEAADGLRFDRLNWVADCLPGTEVVFQTRSASTRALLAQATWTGPAGADSFYQKPGAALTGTEAGHRWLQYRAVLKSRDNANSALLRKVEIGLARR